MIIRVELRIFTYNLRICCGKYEDVTSISEAMYASVTVHVHVVVKIHMYMYMAVTSSTLQVHGWY